MTSRGITSPVLAAVQAETVARTLAVDFDFPSGFVRLNASAVSIFIGGYEYLGVGALGGVSSAQEGVELRSYGLAMTLSGIPRDSIALALADDYRNRRAQVWEVVMDPATWAVLSDPILLWRGRMDTMSVDLGTTAQITINVESRMRDWERVQGTLATDEEQQRRHAGDTFFAFVSDTALRNVEWPAASFTSGGPSGVGGGMIGAVHAVSGG